MPRIQIILKKGPWDFPEKRSWLVTVFFLLYLICDGCLLLYVRNEKPISIWFNSTCSGLSTGSTIGNSVSFNIKGKNQGARIRAASHR